MQIIRIAARVVATPTQLGKRAAFASVSRHMRMRDDFAAKTKHSLAMRVAYICSNPDCRALTSGPNSDSSKTVMVGVAAHITAAAAGGPRIHPLLTAHQRPHAENEISLWQNCCKLNDY